MVMHTQVRHVAVAIATNL